MVTKLLKVFDERTHFFDSFDAAVNIVNETYGKRVEDARGNAYSIIVTWP